MQIILSTTSTFGTESENLLKIIRDRKLRLVKNQLGRKLTETELQGMFKKFKPVGLLAGTEIISRQTLRQARDYLRVISRVGVGWDNVDNSAAREFGIKVYRTEGVLNQSVAELTIGLILNALRNISRVDRNIRSRI